jgi:hypothetical protein
VSIAQVPSPKYHRALSAFSTLPVNCAIKPVAEPVAVAQGAGHVNPRRCAYGRIAPFRFSTHVAMALPANWPENSTRDFTPVGWVPKGRGAAVAGSPAVFNVINFKS